MKIQRLPWYAKVLFFITFQYWFCLFLICAANSYLDIALESSRRHQSSCHPKLIIVLEWETQDQVALSSLSDIETCEKIYFLTTFYLHLNVKLIGFCLLWSSSNISYSSIWFYSITFLLLRAVVRLCRWEQLFKTLFSRLISTIKFILTNQFRCLSSQLEYLWSLRRRWQEDSISKKKLLFSCSLKSILQLQLQQHFLLFPAGRLKLHFYFLVCESEIWKDKSTLYSLWLQWIDWYKAQSSSVHSKESSIFWCWYCHPTKRVRTCLWV